MRKVTEKQFDVFYAKQNKLELSALSFVDRWNKSGSVVIRKIIRVVDQKVIGIIVNWNKFWIVD